MKIELKAGPCITKGPFLFAFPPGMPERRRLYLKWQDLHGNLRRQKTFWLIQRIMTAIIFLREMF